MPISIQSIVGSASMNVLHTLVSSILILQINWYTRSCFFFSLILPLWKRFFFLPDWWWRPTPLKVCCQVFTYNNGGKKKKRSTEKTFSSYSPFVFPSFLVLTWDLALKKDYKIDKQSNNLDMFAWDDVIRSLLCSSYFIFFGWLGILIDCCCFKLVFLLPGDGWCWFTLLRDRLLRGSHHLSLFLWLNRCGIGCCGRRMKIRLLMLLMMISGESGCGCSGRSHGRYRRRVNGTRVEMLLVMVGMILLLASEWRIRCGWNCGWSDATQMMVMITVIVMVVMMLDQRSVGTSVSAPVRHSGMPWMRNVAELLRISRRVFAQLTLSRRYFCCCWIISRSTGTDHGQTRYPFGPSFRFLLDLYSSHPLRKCLAYTDWNL